MGASVIGSDKDDLDPHTANALPRGNRPLRHYTAGRHLSPHVGRGDTRPCDWRPSAAARDFFDPTSQQFVCGFNPSGTADDTVLVAKIIGDDGSLVGTIVNYACHPTTLAWQNTLISPDYVGALRETVEQHTGAPCMF